MALANGGQASVRISEIGEALIEIIND